MYFFLIQFYRLCLNPLINTFNFINNNFPKSKLQHQIDWLVNNTKFLFIDQSTNNYCLLIIYIFLLIIINKFTLLHIIQNQLNLTPNNINYLQIQPFVLKYYYSLKYIQNLANKINLRTQLLKKMLYFNLYNSHLISHIFFLYYQNLKEPYKYRNYIYKNLKYNILLKIHYYQKYFLLNKHVNNIISLQLNFEYLHKCMLKYYLHLYIHSINISIYQYQLMNFNFKLSIQR